MIILLNGWGDAWGAWFLATVLQNTVFLLLVLLALRLLRKASARVLAAVATAGVVKLAVPPFISTSWFAGGTAETLADPVAPLLFPFSSDAAPQFEIVTELTGGLSPAAVLMLVWASIAAARLGWALLQTLQLYIELRRSRPVDLSQIPTGMLGQGLDVRWSERIAFPLTMGLFHRRVLVPAAWNGWSDADREAVLRHELAHMRRRDNLAQPLEVMVQAVFFFHPLVHLLIGRLRVWREIACDDMSVDGDPHRRLAYSRFLVNLAETVLERGPLAESASMLARRKGELKKRVTHQVKEGIMKPVPKIRLAVVLTVLLAAFVPLSLVHGDDPPPPPKKAEPVAAPVAQAEVSKPEKEVKKSDPADPEAPPPPPPAVHVGVTAEGLTVNGEKVTDGQFNDAVQKAMQAEGAKVVIKIDSDSGVTMGKVQAMQAQLKEMGLMKVIYTGELGESVSMVLPPDKAKKKLAQMPEELVLPVKVDGAGILTVGGKKIHGADLPEVIHNKMTKEPRLVVVYHTDKDTRYGAFVQVLEGLKKGGANKIAILDPDK